MKRFFKMLALSVVFVLTAGCTDKLEDEIAALKTRIAAAENTCLQLNQSITSLNEMLKALENNIFIKSVTENNGSYVITFSNGKTITLTDGKDGVEAMIGIAQYTDGNYYWTMQQGGGTPSYITVNGSKMRASGNVPLLGIDDQGYWRISYDNGKTWTSLRSPATGQEGGAIFKSIDTTNPEFVRFTLSSGTVFTVPTVYAFELVEQSIEKMNTSVENLGKLLTKMDSTVLVSEVAQIVENETVVGYSIKMTDGSEVELYNGTDGVPFRLGAAEDTDGKKYWTISFGNSEEFDWLLDDNGDKMSLDIDMGAPQLSARDSLGEFYFTVAYRGSTDFNWLLNGNGEKVRASGYLGYCMFKKIEFTDKAVIITLADGQVMSLPFYVEGTPTISFSVAGMTLNEHLQYVPGVTSYTRYTVDMLIKDYFPEVKIEAIGLDNIIVQSLAIGEVVTELDSVVNVTGFETSYDTTFVAVDEKAQIIDEALLALIQELNLSLILDESLFKTDTIYTFRDTEFVNGPNDTVYIRDTIKVDYDTTFLGDHGILADIDGRYVDSAGVLLPQDTTFFYETNYFLDTLGTAGTITFRTPNQFEEGVTSSRIMVFMTWGQKMTMKVLEFLNLN